MTYRLAFRQLAGNAMSRVAAAVFHPAFWLARLFLNRANVTATFPPYR